MNNQQTLDPINTGIYPEPTMDEPDIVAGDLILVDFWRFEFSSYFSSFPV